MGRAREERSVSVHASHESLAACLQRLDSSSCERSAQRLTHADLLTLARFQAQPHVLIHHAVSALQIVLLSISVQHQNPHSVLQVQSWPLLRLELLTHVDAIWHKMWRRLAKLRRSSRDPRRKPLATAQIRFVLQYVLSPSIAHDDDSGSPRSENPLHAFSRVSSIAESIAAFALLCALYSLVPPTASSPMKPAAVLAPPISPTKPIVISPAATAAECHAMSWHCGLKHNGRFVLFRASLIRATERSYARSSWSVLVVDRRHAAVEGRRIIDVAASDRSRPEQCVERDHGRAWRAHDSIPSVVLTIVRDVSHNRAHVAECIATILVQSAGQCGLFRSPALSSAFSVTPSIVTIPTLILFLAVVTMDESLGLTLCAVGHAILHDARSATIADIRRHLLATWNRDGASTENSFQFITRSTLLPLAEEPWRKAAELLPFGVLVRLDSACQHPSRRTSWLSAASRFHDEGCHRLCRHLPPRWMLESSAIAPCSPVSLCLYRVNQEISSPLSSSSSRPSFSSPLLNIPDIFLDWSTFVHFQQLQNSVSIYRTPSETPPTVLKPKHITDYLLETAKLKPEPSPGELIRMSLPREPFCPRVEYLKPLYITASIQSPTSASINSTSCGVLAHVLCASHSGRARLVVGHEECVIHITEEPHPLQNGGERPVRLHFQRDASCPVEILLTQRDAFVWVITPLTPPKHKRKALSSHPSAPPRWLQDVLRFVTHPTLDFTNTKTPLSLWPFPGRFFQVAVPYAVIEAFVEATFWSRGVDWSTHCLRLNAQSALLQPKFEALCESHPRSWSIDSVKFSNFLRECGLQPTVLSLGDAALLFTTHRAPGSHYEMTYDGFLSALRWIARRIYRSEEEEDALRQLCLDWLIGAPSMFDWWHSVVNRWRLEEKLQRMEVAAIQYCAATRIRAHWKQFVTRRTLVDTLNRMKLERRAATKPQSIFKMRKQRKQYVVHRDIIVRTQRFLQARHLLRQLRVERAELVERMRRKLQKWMRQRLRVLRCWKTINEAWLRRRARIREKRSRLVASGAFTIENRIWRASLYRTDGLGASEDAAFDLELVEPSRSWFYVIYVARDLLNRLEAEAHDVLGFKKPVLARERGRWLLRVLMQRLQFKKARQSTSRDTLSDARTTVVQFYRDPIDSSLGRLVYHGGVKGQVVKSTASEVFLVRLLSRGHDFALVLYSACTSTKRRVVFTSSFVYRVFQLSHWLGLTIPRDDDEEQEPARESMLSREIVMEALVHRPDRLLALRLLLDYLHVHDLKWPTWDMLPEVIARREAEVQAGLTAAKRLEEQRVLGLVIRSQANARRCLAIRAVQNIARHSYLKCFDVQQKALVYKLQRRHDVLTYTTKPRTLGNCDAALARDEWLRNEHAMDPSKQLFNPLRGIFSRINDVQAAIVVQRRFRRHMWTCLARWDLKRLSEALLFHHRVQTPKDLGNPKEVTAITQYALQLHTMHHDFRTATAHYEAALALDADHTMALVGLAILLIYTCKYPSKQSWSKGLALLDSARSKDRDLVATLAPIEHNCFRWAVHLHPKSAEALGNLAVYMQCVRGELDTAELLYRRAIDVDAGNEKVIANYIRLMQERSPEGLYRAAGPSKTSIWAARVIQQVGDSNWRELEDVGARVPSARRFFRNIQTGECVWTLADVAEVVE